MRMYTTIQGDTWDMIAKAMYGDEKQLDILMEENPDLLDFVIFPAGIQLAVPDLPAERESGWPDWRR